MTVTFKLSRVLYVYVYVYFSAGRNFRKHPQYFVIFERIKTQTYAAATVEMPCSSIRRHQVYNIYTLGHNYV